ncbi:helix-turn-helix domain-containing protein [Erythrobacter arachoides]|uniref:Helix-turn-helix domain-containing protein n=1 Tax=Aurantiacibacter arachoides TaxID=1850444 RepID=A0A845A1M3_9SPHN|nr:AraC family transcriptional regulator [Aurantiacibacter arachoides]MXO93818.1 helix-turn-helix domain-containing protein [Aurantiacibacter arachoides]GGD46439.1 transcriptional regulator [Aurantiacibacter arachoides]
MAALPKDDQSWSSDGLARPEAISQWREWAESTIAPIEVEVFDPAGFAARWVAHGLGQLRLLHLHAPAQRVTRNAAEGSAGRATPSIHLIYPRSGALKSAMGGRRFDLRPGQVAMLENTWYYQFDVATPHECIVVMMPQTWLEKHLPDPLALLSQPIDVSAGWGAPLGALLETIADGLDRAPLPRPLIAEQLGSLLALATGFHEPAETTRHRGQLARRILRRIEGDYTDPDLSPERVAADCGISKRYLQTLLAGSGTSFVQELNAMRLDRASDLLIDPRARSLSVADIAYRTGFLDPGYFTRLFRKRFGMTPSQWRGGHTHTFEEQV